MRIGVDCTPMQAGSSRDRGIGRYTLTLLRALTASDPNHEYILYHAVGQPPCSVAPGARAAARSVPVPPDAPTAIVQAVSGNPDSLDLLLLTSTHQSRMVGKRGVPAVAALLYDLIPERHPEIYFANDHYRQGYDRYLEEIRGYDLYLAISESTRRDFIERRDFPADRIVTLPPAVDHDRFRPAAAEAPWPAVLTALGIAQPYVLHVGGMDSRKGGLELIEAFGRLPRSVRERHQLVYAYAQRDSYQADRMRDAAAHEVRLILTGYVPEETLVALYQHAAVMAFPSKSEGLGMPVLEALASGTPVVAGNNTSLPELVGPAGLLVEAGDPPTIARALEHLLSDPRRRALLSHAGARRVRSFTWKRTARTALEAFAAIPACSFPGSPIKRGRKVITMCHYKRPQYSREVLDALRACDGIGDYLILPHVEPGDEEVRALIEAIDFAECLPTFHNIRQGLNANTENALADGFARSDYVIHLEDDILCAPDALRYFEWCRARFAADESVFTVSGYNREPDPSVPNMYHRVRRRRSFTPIGWATWRNRWDQFGGALRVLPYPWDMFMNDAFPASGIPQFQVEVFPELSRVQHIGLISSISFETPEWYEEHFSVKCWSGDAGVPAGEFHGCRIGWGRERSADERR